MQENSRARFRIAVAYVRSVRQQPHVYAIYKTAAQIKRKRPCDLALADCLNPPQIGDVELSAYTGQPGQLISIEAFDDFEVASVRVVIRDLNGTVLEEGDAAPKPTPKSHWEYTSTAEVPAGKTVSVEIRAVDRPGNRTSKTFDHACLR
jgi:hypothetical protein